MILEIADLLIHPGQEAEFDLAIQRGLDSVFPRAKGFVRHQLNKGIESPERYILMIYWEKLEDHTVAFRESPLFLEWRAIISPYLAHPPIVEHFSLPKNSKVAE